jgi:hypothetical protein
MPEFKAQPIDVISLPNIYAPLSLWTVTNTNAQTLYFQLQMVDSLGTRRYISPSGSVLTATFRRMDLITGGASNIGGGQINQQNRDVIKTAVFDVNDRSICSIPMTSQDMAGIVSGGVLFTLTSGATASKWIQDWLVRKTSNDLGF